MKFLILFPAVLSLAWCFSPARAMAQAVTVQQPVVGVFSVDTVVSVPDRGRMFLGGVNSAGSSRSTYGFGPFRQGAYSQFANTGSMDVGVYVFDFEALDQALLAQPTVRTETAPVVPHAEDAWLFAERTRPAAARGVVAPAGGTRDVAPAGTNSRQGPPETSDPAQLAAFYYERGQSAESKGRSGAAVLCYRMAAKYGSQDAVDRLTTLAAR